MQLRFGLTLALSALSLAGCNSIGISNGSLDYKNTTTLEPLKYPEGSMIRPATPMYPAPIVDALALEHAPNFDNKSGNRFDLPRPKAAQGSAQANSNAEAPVGRPQLLKDGNGNPLLRIDGSHATTWQYTLATLSSLNQQIIAQSKNSYEATIKVGEQNYVVRLNAVGLSNNIAIFNPDNSFADKTIASELLTQIFQNWPA